MKINDVQRTIVAQVREQVFVKNGTCFIVDESTVRFHMSGSLNVDVEYDRGHDLYNVSVHRLKKDYTTTTETHSLVYAEDLARYFPKHLVKDANVRALFAALAAA